MRFERNRQDVGRIPQTGDKFSGIGGADAYTKLLLHFNGDAKDDSLVSRPVNVLKCTIDAAQSKFGEYSAKFVAASKEYIAIPDHDDFYFLGNFTIDCWLRFATLPTGTGGAMVFYGGYQDSSNFQYACLRNDGSNNYDWQANASAGGTPCYSGLQRANPKPVVNQWYHVAIVRTGNDWMIFQDGVQIGSTATDTDPMPNITTPFCIGYIGLAASTAYFNGWIDEFRVSKGIARWTGNFTPPTRPYTRKNWE